MTERFIRNEMLLGPRAMEKLKSSHVCVEIGRAHV